jgi:Protein of unknown function (DUF3179)
LTGTDSLSWKRKSWVVGIDIGGESKAYDWNRLVKERVINDFVGNKSVVIALAADNKSFVAFEHAFKNNQFAIQNDTLLLDSRRFTLDGQVALTIDDEHKIPLKPIKAYQEFWHSWLNFHPKTLKY